MKKKCFTKYWKLKFKPHPFNAIYDNARQNSIDKLRERYDALGDTCVIVYYWLVS